MYSFNSKYSAAVYISVKIKTAVYAISGAVYLLVLHH
jgi:hypothetical protein